MSCRQLRRHKQHPRFQMTLSQIYNNTKCNNATPQVTPQGRGPAWASSLLEDNAQFGFGIYTGLKQRRQAYMAAAQQLLDGAAAAVDDDTAAGKGFGSAVLRAALQEWLQVSQGTGLWFCGSKSVVYVSESSTRQQCLKVVHLLFEAS